MSEFTSKVKVKVSSEKNFGLVFGAVSLVVSVWVFVRGGNFWALFLLIAIAFIALAFLAPSILRVPNRLWFRFGLILHSIISPIVMGLIYIVTFLPFGVVFRIAGKDPLARGFDPDAETYWKPREKAPQSMSRLF